MGGDGRARSRRSGGRLRISEGARRFRCPPISEYRCSKGVFLPGSDIEVLGLMRGVGAWFRNEPTGSPSLQSQGLIASEPGRPSSNIPSCVIRMDSQLHAEIVTHLLPNRPAPRAVLVPSVGSMHQRRSSRPVGVPLPDHPRYRLRSQRRLTHEPNLQNPRDAHEQERGPPRKPLLLLGLPRPAPRRGRTHLSGSRVRQQLRSRHDHR